MILASATIASADGMPSGSGHVWLDSFKACPRPVIAWAMIGFLPRTLDLHARNLPRALVEHGLDQSMAFGFST